MYIGFWLCFLSGGKEAESVFGRLDFVEPIAKPTLRSVFFVGGAAMDSVQTEGKRMTSHSETEVRGKITQIRMFTVREVASALHVHPNTVRHWCDHGLLKTSRVGPRGDRRFYWEDINNFVNKWNNSAQSVNPCCRKVLIVDNEYRIRCLLEDIVEEQGCEAISVASVNAALNELIKQDFDIVFLTLALPGSDGLDVLQAIRAKGKRPIVVGITTHDDGLIALEAMSMGPLILIRKPFDTADIINVLDMISAQSAKV